MQKLYNREKKGIFRADSRHLSRRGKPEDVFNEICVSGVWASASSRLTFRVCVWKGTEATSSLKETREENFNSDSVH